MVEFAKCPVRNNTNTEESPCSFIFVYLVDMVDMVA